MKSGTHMFQVAIKAHIIDVWVLKLEPFDSKIILYDTIVVDICHYVFVKTHGLYNAKREP